MLVIGSLLVVFGVMGFWQAYSGGGTGTGLYAVVIALGVLVELGAVVTHVIRMVPKPGRRTGQGTTD
jgi:hypothetical protein